MDIYSGYKDVSNNWSLLEIFEYWSNYYNTCIKLKIMADVMFRAIFWLEMAQEIEKK